MRFDEDKFNANFIATIGIDVRDKYLTIQGKRVKLRCWDSAGQERFKNITANYCTRSPPLPSVDVASNLNVILSLDELFRSRSSRCFVGL